MPHIHRTFSTRALRVEVSLLNSDWLENGVISYKKSLRKGAKLMDDKPTKEYKTYGNTKSKMRDGTG